MCVNKNREWKKKEAVRRLLHKEERESGRERGKRGERQARLQRSKGFKGEKSPGRGEREDGRREKK